MKAPKSKSFVGRHSREVSQTDETEQQETKEERCSLRPPNVTRSMSEGRNRTASAGSFGSSDVNLNDILESISRDTLRPRGSRPIFHTYIGSQNSENDSHLTVPSNIRSAASEASLQPSLRKLRSGPKLFIGNIDEEEESVPSTDKLSDLAATHDIRRKVHFENLSSKYSESRVLPAATPQLFIELDELEHPKTDSDAPLWRETHRWFQYEEDLQYGADRWGKPHVPSLSFHSLLELRLSIENGCVLFNLQGPDARTTLTEVVDQMARWYSIPNDHKEKILQLMLLRHIHVGERMDGMTRNDRNYSSLRKLYSQKSVVSDLEKQQQAKNGWLNANDMDRSDQQQDWGGDVWKWLPSETEGANVMVGRADFVQQPMTAFVRFGTALDLPRVAEVRIAVRFIFLLLAPSSFDINQHEIGRSIATLLSNRRFQHAAYSVDNVSDLIHAINEFLDDSVVLPPGDWDQKLIPKRQIKQATSDLSRRRRQISRKLSREDLVEAEYCDPLERTGRWFGGVVNELKTRFPKYQSDLVDFFEVRCILSVLFIFFTCFIPTLTFGAIISTETHGSLSVPDALLSVSLGGMLFALFSTQPLLIIGIIGPVLLFEEALFHLCEQWSCGYAPLRFWVSCWAGVFGLVTVAFELPYLIRYMTRFSDDIFSVLVSLIFTVECFSFVKKIFKLHPLIGLCDHCLQVSALISYGCHADVRNNSYDDILLPKASTNTSPSSNFQFGSRMEVETTDVQHFAQDAVGLKQPNTALLTLLLVFGTFTVAWTLRKFRKSKYFGREIRKALGELGLTVAVLTMVIADHFILHDSRVTSKLNIAPFEHRGSLLVEWPLAVSWYTPLASSIPGFFLFVIIFMETEVTELVLSKKEHKLKKGTGYHWDLLLSCILLIFCAILSLPWLCAASIQSKAHIGSLIKYKPRAPGQTPKVESIAEQRITAFLLHLLIGLTLIGSDILNLIPLSVLFGVFLYLSIMNMVGVEMLDRTILFFVPTKHHPSLPYCTKVRTWRMNVYTTIQLFCFAVACTVKSIKKISFAFPFFIGVATVVRAKVLPKIFTESELEALDGGESEGEEESIEEDFYEESRLPTVSSFRIVASSAKLADLDQSNNNHQKTYSNPCMHTD